MNNYNAKLFCRPCHVDILKLRGFLKTSIFRKVESYSCILAFRLLEEWPDGIVKFLNTVQNAVRHAHHVFLALSEVLGKLTFHICTYLFIRIDLGRVRRQVDKLELACQALYVGRDQLCCVDVMAIHYHDHHLVYPDKQPFQKHPEHGRIGRPLMHYEAKVPARTHGGQHVQREPAACKRDHRRLATGRPDGTCVVVGTDARFVREVNRGTHLAGIWPNLGVSLLLPSFDKHGVLLPKLIQRLPGRKSQEPHAPVHRGQGQRSAELPVQQFADQGQGPEAIFDLELLWGMVLQRLGDPAHLIAGVLGCSPRNRLGLGCFLAPVHMDGQPVKNRADVHAHH